jgi:uncharacterized protein YegP (UPF0339 family)
MDVLYNLSTWFGGAVAEETVDFYQDQDGDWRWKIVAPNNRVIISASEGFATKGNAKRNYKLVRRVMRRPMLVTESPKLAPGP